MIAKGKNMQVLPLVVTALIGGFVAYVFALFDRGQNLMRLANYPVGILAATTATWISQNVPSMHNKLLVLGFALPTAILLVYRMARHAWMSKQRLSKQLQSV